MIGGLVLALSLAGFGLLVLGERMGLGAGLASAAMLAQFLASGFALALASMTSRLHRYLVGGPRGAILGLAALTAVTLLAGLVLVEGGAVTGRSAAVALVVGFVAAPLLAPFNPWRDLGRFAADERALRLRDRDPGEGTRGALAIVALAGLLALVLILATGLPAILGRLEAVTDWPRGRLWLFAAIFAAAIPLLGGIGGLRRAALFLIAVAFLAALLPLGIQGLRDLAPEADALTLIRRISGAIPDLARNAVPLPAPHDGVPLATGFVLGLALQQVSAPLQGPLARLQGLTLGLLLAIGLALAAVAAREGLETLVSVRLAGLPAGQWPLFVFDDAVRGWITTCGVAPEDPLAAARACGRAGPRDILPPDAIRLAPGLAAPALALSGGYPATLGFIWGILPPLVALSGLGMLMLAAASGFSERVLFRLANPRALRGFRLAMARLSLVALVVLLYGLEARGVAIDPDLARWVLLGLALTMLAAMAGYWLVAGLRLIRRRRARASSAAPESPAPRPAAP